MSDKMDKFQVFKNFDQLHLENDFIGLFHSRRLLNWNVFEMGKLCWIYFLYLFVYIERMSHYIE